MMNTWELALVTSSYSLILGGLAGMVWGYTLVCFGYLPVFASPAETASTSPTSAAQYHWVSEFGPPGQQRFLSYVAGWTAVLGWQACMATVTYTVADMIQGTITLCYPDTYVSQNWHLTLLTVGVNAYCVLFNTSLARRLPMVEGLVLIVRILGFFVVLVPLWTLAPRTDPARVFTEFTHLGGWSSQGLSFVIGLTLPAYNLFGADAPVHMAEEVREAAAVVPRAIMWAYIINAVQAWVLVVSLCFCVGNLKEVLQSPTGVAYIQVFRNVTQSAAATAAMVAMIAVSLTSAAIATLAAMSRLTWAFARDGGLPCSAWISHVKSGWNVPLNSVLLCTVPAVVVATINTVSDEAFRAISSLAMCALLANYVLPLVCLIHRRLRGPRLPARRWSLGRAGLAVNVGALAFLLVIWVFGFFPSDPAGGLAQNLSPIMFVAIVALPFSTT